MLGKVGEEVIRGKGDRSGSLRADEVVEEGGRVGGLYVGEEGVVSVGKEKSWVGAAVVLRPRQRGRLD